MKTIFCPFLLFTLILVSCGVATEKTATKTSSLKYLGEVVLSHGDLLLSNRSGLNKVVGEDSLLVYDQQSKQLILFDLQGKKPIHTINVVLDGPDFFDLPFIDTTIRNDSLFILSQNYFSIYSLAGKIKLRFDKDQLNNSNSIFHISDFQLMDKGDVLFSKVPMDVMVDNFNSKEKPNLFFTFDLSKESFSEKKVFSPTESLIDDENQGYYNDLAFHHMVVNDGSIIYSFPFTSKIFVYDLQANNKSEVEVTSQFAENLRKPISVSDNNDTKKWAEYMYSSSKYSAIERDSKTSYFLRVGIQYKKISDGLSQSSKYITLIDNKLQKIEEIEVADKVFPDPIVSNGIVYLLKVDQPREDAYTFIAYEIVK
jgi:hypothetical protein